MSFIIRNSELELKRIIVPGSMTRKAFNKYKNKTCYGVQSESSTIENLNQFTFTPLRKLVRDNNLKTPEDVLTYLKENEYDSVGWYETTSKRPPKYILYLIAGIDPAPLDKYTEDDIEIFVMQVIGWLFELNKL
jgi:hypothetical protein